MTSGAVSDLLIEKTTEFGGALLVILGFVIAIGVGMLVFRAGWNSVKNSSK